MAGAQVPQPCGLKQSVKDDGAIDRAAIAYDFEQLQQLFPYLVTLRHGGDVVIIVINIMTRRCDLGYCYCLGVTKQ